MSIGVFGLIGLLAIVTCTLWIIFVKKKETYGALFNSNMNKKIIVACYMVVLLFLISYFRLPQKSGYMISVLPFLIIIFGYYLNSKLFQFLSFAFIVSSFVCSINLTDKLRGASYSRYAITFKVSGQELFFDPVSGPIFSDVSKRKQKAKYTGEVIQKMDSISFKTVVIAGWWYNELMVTMIPLKKNEHVILEPYINAEKIKKYSSQGYSIKYLPEQNTYNDEMFKMDITNSYSTKF